jgi:starvation-inducible outer membrane lipoprotein
MGRRHRGLLLVLCATLFAALTFSLESSAAADSPGVTATSDTRSGTYVPLSPTRLLDTRIGLGAGRVAVPAHGTVLLQVAGLADVPATVSAVVLNVTVTSPLAAGDINAYPAGGATPRSSTLNFVKGQTVANAAVVPVGTGGRVALTNESNGTLHLIADISGFFEPGSPVAAGAFGAVSPTRVLDTRIGLGAGRVAVPAHGTVLLQVADTGSVPAAASAVVVNVTVTSPGAAGDINAYPAGAAAPRSSTLNFAKGQTVANLAVVPVGSGGRIALTNESNGTVELIADLSGYFRSGQPTLSGGFGAVSPTRVLDTRIGQGAARVAVPAHGTVQVQVAGTAGIPATASAVVVNVTVTSPGAAGDINAYPAGAAAPRSSTLNFAKGQTVANLAVVPVGSGGRIALTNESNGTVQLIADVSGSFLRDDTQCVAAAGSQLRHYDLVVYGATPAGVMAAIQAQREGLSAAVVEPSDHFGGMLTGGLSATDVGPVAGIISGLSKEFFSRVGSVYHRTDGWNFEPRVGEQVLTAMLTESGAALFLNEPLPDNGGVTRSGTTISCMTSATGDVFTAAEFVDAGYEGDLMARADVSWTYGRESSAQYGESLAGVQRLSSDFNPSVSARGTNGAVLQQVSTATLGPLGSADTAVQAYGYRFEVTKAADRIPFAAPADYDPARYTLLAQYLPKLSARLKRDLKVSDVLKLSPLPNGEYDVNNSGPFSTDFVGGNVGYVTGDAATRAAIAARTRSYDQGLMYFLVNDPQVPQSIRTELGAYGLPPQEFVDSGHFPDQMYVREARRMVGAMVLTQADVQTATANKADSIGLGGYRIDTHANIRVIDKDGNARNEGSLNGATSTYQLPYRMLTPQASQATNLLVVGAISASHVALAAVRMEPQLMTLGQAAGAAAALALTGRTSVQAVPIAQLQTDLRGRGVILDAGAPIVIQASAADPRQTSASGSWATNDPAPHLVTDNAAAGSTVVFRPNVTANGAYEVFARWPASSVNTDTATFVISSNGKTTTVVRNQQVDGDTWVSLGTFTFAAGSAGTITVSSGSGTGNLVADTVRLVK